ncbi:MAG: methyl-accepting chemotaxis protein [Granulosicoccus sp.]
MKFEKLIRIALATVALALIALALAKPSVNSDYHAKYVENLDTFEALSGSLVRNHLLVRHGQINHYDFLEIDLQKMQRSAQLAAIVPEHVNDDFHETAQSLSSNYLVQLDSIRAYVELSKRGIGLLKNSNRAVELLLADLNNQLAYNVVNDNATVVLRLVVKINQAFRVKAEIGNVDRLLDELLATNAVTAHIVAQLRLHVRILQAFEDPVEHASSSLYKEVEALHQPDILRAQYLAKHEAVVAGTTWLLWTSYVLAALLVALAVLLSIVASKAQKRTQEAMRETDAAREFTEQQITETRNAIAQCNELLDKVGKGDFSDRIEGSFSEELESLRLGVNQAADSVQFTMSELHRVMDHMQRGDFTTRIEERVTGDFRIQVDKTNKRLQSILSSICEVMDDMRRGDFSRRIDMTLEGSFDTLKSSVNDSMSILCDSLGEISSVVDHQRHGDFSYRVQGDWPGDLGTLSQSLDGTGGAILEMVGQIQQLSHQVAQVSHAVLGNSQLLKAQSDQQANAIDMALQSSNNVSELIKQNRESTNAASVLAVSSQREASECRAISDNSIQSMQTVTAKIFEINKITETIATIAAKTNLLALNAAVEASRAGESGSGFSVVAGEVKALARMSAEASARIAEIVQDTGNEAKLGSSAVKGASKALELIETSAKNVGAINREVSDASQQQYEELQTMTDKVHEAFELTKTNQSTAADTYATSESLDELAQQMATLVDFFNTERKQDERLSKAA